MIGLTGSDDGPNVIRVWPNHVPEADREHWNADSDSYGNGGVILTADDIGKRSCMAKAVRLRAWFGAPTAPLAWHHDELVLVLKVTREATFFGRDDGLVWSARPDLVDVIKVTP